MKPQRLFLRISKGQCYSKYRAPEYYAQNCPLEDTKHPIKSLLAVN